MGNILEIQVSFRHQRNYLSDDLREKVEHDMIEYASKLGLGVSVISIRE